MINSFLIIFLISSQFSLFNTSDSVVEAILLESMDT